jgi:hypothetical protein
LAIDGAAGAAAVLAPPPQADRETVQTAAAVTTANLKERMIGVVPFENGKLETDVGCSTLVYDAVS